MDSLHSQIAVPYLVETVAFLLSVVAIVPLFKRLNLSPILGYLAVGALIGPHSLAVVHDVEGVQHFAELGVIFLLFTIGLELSFERLKAYSLLIFGLGAAQVLLTTIAIGGVALAWGNNTQASIIIGLCLALSSTAMVVQILTERGEMSSNHGRASFAVLLFQDLAVVPILILVSIFGGEGEGNIWLGVAVALAKAIVAVVFIVLFGRVVLRRLFHIVAKSNSVDVFTAMMLLAILATSLLTGLAGLSMALGAFLAGLLLAETEFRHQVESEIEPFKGLLLGLFFMGVGMNLDFGVAFQRGIWVILSIFGLIFIKALIAGSVAILFRLSLKDAIRTGLMVAEGGEFAFVVIGQATLTYQIIQPEVGQFMVIVAGLSMLMTPLLAIAGKQISKILDRTPGLNELAETAPQAQHDHVIIAGFGRVGRAVAGVLRQQAISFIAIDSNVETVNRQRLCGEPVFLGDAARPELLKRAGIANASVLLVTMDNTHAAQKTVHAARQHWPDLTILVRSHDLQHAEELISAGATKVVPETLEASLQLAGHVLFSLGLPRAEAYACTDAIRRANYTDIAEHN